jgi:hypothetical protein
VTRVLYVDSGPMAEGQAVDATLSTDVVDHELPPWDLFEDADLMDLTDELRVVFRYEIVDLPTGHWPMFTRPRGLAEVMIAALR